MSKKIEGFIEKMRGTSSANVKVEIIKYESKFIHKVLEYTYNPFKQFHVTSKTCRKNLHLGQGLVGSVQHGNSYGLFEVLDKLIRREVTGHDAIKLVNGYALGDDSIYKIIDKDLGIRAGVTIINKAIDGLVPAFKVALAKEYESGKCNWNDGWYASRKLDGVRCLAITDEDGNCKLYSRMGKEFTTLNKVKEAIEATNIVNTVFDGEICLVDEDGNEDFQGIMKQLRRKDHQIENPAYMMFDMLNIKDFNNQKSEEILSDRLHTLRSFLNDRLHTLRSFLNIDTQILRYTEQALINDDEHFETWSKIADYFNWEGVMLRKDVGYEGKRTKNLVKVKQFHDAEYEVIDYDNDDHEVVRDGKSETIKMLAQVWIEHKGYRVKVGSGWSQEQRLQYMDGSIVGKIITVQYFEETYNDKGGISLRFPTVKVVHGEEREV